VGSFAGTLAVTFSPTENTHGTFAWQGDALTWSAPGLTRPQASAWYVCEGQQLFVNLGAYLSGTPAGCADQTVSGDLLLLFMRVRVVMEMELF